MHTVDMVMSCKSCLNPTASPVEKIDETSNLSYRLKLSKESWVMARKSALSYHGAFLQRHI